MHDALYHLLHDSDVDISIKGGSGYRESPDIEGMETVIKSLSPGFREALKSLLFYCRREKFVQVATLFTSENFPGLRVLKIHLESYDEDERQDREVELFELCLERANPLLTLKLRGKRYEDEEEQREQEKHGGYNEPDSFIES